MALVVCPECKKQISDRAKACPHCGFPMEEHIRSNDENKSSKIVDDIENLICPKCGAQYYRGSKFCRKCGNPIIGTVESNPISDGENIIRQIVSVDVEENLICPKCGAQYYKGSKFCRNCGNPIIGTVEIAPISDGENIIKQTVSVDVKENLICPKCGAEYHMGSKFCRNCGNPITGTVESTPILVGESIIEQTVFTDSEYNTIIVDNVENQNQKNKYPGFNFPDDMSDEEKQNIVNKASELKEGLDNLGKKMGIPPKDFIPVPNEPCAAPNNLTTLKSEMQRLLNYFGERTVDFQMYNSFLKQFNSLLEGGSLLFACAVGGFLGMVACVFIAEVFLGVDHVGLLMEWFLFILLTVIIYVPAKKATEKKKVELTDNLMFLRKKLIWHYNNATNCFISYDYCNPVIISAMYNNLLSGRATTYASALNVYLSDETTRMMIQKMNEQFEKMERDINRIHREIRRDMNNRRY